MKNIVLIGFMGSGKSTIASVLSNRLNMAHIDSDTYIEEETHMSIIDIFKFKGEDYFRFLESKFIQSFCNTSDYVISTGGGMPIFNDIEDLGIIIYLDATFNVIRNRIEQANIDQGNKRPLFDDIQKAYSLYNDRQSIYKAKSNYCINANQNLDMIIDDILNTLDLNYI